MGTIVYIAEKPSVAKAIAPILGCKKTKKGCITNEDESVFVTWLYGHVLELVDADAYDPKYKKWNLETLPIIPDEFLVRPSADKKSKGKVVEDCSYKRNQLKTISDLIGESDEVCIATDPDAEGELLAMEVIDFIGYKGPLTRIFPTSLDNVTINKCISNKQDASLSRGYYMAGLARSHIDWMVGINITRGLTSFNRNMIDSPLNAGRVQTFIIGLLHKNTISRKEFKQKNTYSIEAECNKNNQIFTLKWKPQDVSMLDTSNEKYCSETAKQHCLGIIGSIEKKELSVTEVIKERKTTSPRLGFSLTDLQILASKQLGITASQTLKLTQGLYEKKHVTYPRSDCKYLPASQIKNAETIIPKILQITGIKNIEQDIDLSKKTKSWNDSKIENHHAIIPTLDTPSDSALKGDELALYAMICKRYISQFLPDYEYDSTIIEATNSGEVFRATGKITAIEGWHICEQPEAESSSEERFPQLTKFDILNANYKIKTGKTTPPKALNEGSLLTTLANAYKLVDDEDLAKKLKKRHKGIGTVATTGNIIEQMTHNKFIQVVKKNYELTKKGMLMAQIAPPLLLDANLTAKLDFELTGIENNKSSYTDVVSGYKDRVKIMISKIINGESRLPEPLIKTSPCPSCSANACVKRKSEKRTFWICLTCKKYANDELGRPKIIPELKKIECGICSKKTLTQYPIKDSKNEFRWYCKECQSKYPNINDKPDYITHKCPNCDGNIEKLYSTKRKRYFWVCQNKELCGKISSDFEHKPLKITPIEPSGIKCEVCKSGDVNKIKGGYGDFWSCSNWKKDKSGCNAKYIDSDGTPLVQIEVKGQPCPDCKNGEIFKKIGKYGDFWSCNNWNKKGKDKCNFKCKDNNGIPLIDPIKNKK